ncbi:hypothetical protein BD779DRAFT_667244 [Infundibulicybe gibba]|nr:hypothetical protein BD779DRAFT_667244 [Infundibulicybe gibba]
MRRVVIVAVGPVSTRALICLMHAIYGCQSFKLTGKRPSRSTQPVSSGRNGWEQYNKLASLYSNTMALSYKFYCGKIQSGPL